MLSRLLNKIFIVELLAYLISITNIMIDVAFAGKYFGVQASAACGYSLPIITFAFAITTMLETGTQAACGKLIGKLSTKKANAVYNSSFVFAVILSLIMSVLGIFFSPYFSTLLGAQENSEAFNMTCSFLSGLSIGIPAIMIFETTLPVLQIDNDRKRAIIAAVSLGISNIVVLILIMNFTNLGIFGIGLSTSISFYIAMIISLCHFLKKDTIFKISFSYKRLIDVKSISKVLINGLPYAIANFSNALFMLFMNYILVFISGETAVAAFAVIDAISLVWNCVGWCLGSSTLLVGNIFFGERNKELLLDLIKAFIRKSIVFNLVIIILLNLFCEDIVLCFTDKNNEIFNVIIFALRLYSLSLIFYSIASCFRNLIQASGHILLTQLECIMQNLIFPIIAALFCGIFFGYEYLWFFYLFLEIASLIFIVILAKCVTKGKVFSLSTYLFKERSYFPESKSYLNIIINKNFNFQNSFEIIKNFGEQNNLNDKTTKCINLIVEEHASNIIKIGIKNNRQKIAFLRILNKKDAVELAFRDNCNLINCEQLINDYVENKALEHKSDLSLIHGFSSSYNYNDSLGLNYFLIIVDKKM